jgi:hypothetical protein
MKFWSLIFTVKGPMCPQSTALRHSIFGDIRKTDPTNKTSARFLKKNPAPEHLTDWCSNHHPRSNYTGYVGARDGILSPETMGEVALALFRLPTRYMVSSSID